MDRNSNVNLDDVWDLKHAMRELGYYQPPDFGMHQYPDDGLFEGIKRFQADNDLEVDGIMKPGGETETTLSQLVETSGRTRNKNGDVPISKNKDAPKPDGCLTCSWPPGTQDNKRSGYPRGYEVIAPNGTIRQCKKTWWGGCELKDTNRHTTPE
ncbi:MAG: peptidoglycan-binding protein [Alphaproteobacteria bacterium]